MKRLVLDTVVTQQQPAIGEDAVHVKYHELHIGSSRKNFRRCLHQSDHPGAQKIVHAQYAHEPVLFVDHKQ